MLLSSSTLAHEWHWDIVSADKVVVGSKVDDAEGEKIGQCVCSFTKAALFTHPRSMTN